MTDDPLHAAAVSVRDTPGLIAPMLILAEVANGLWKYARTGLLDVNDVLEATALLRAELLLIADAELIGAAQRLSLERHHPVYDCLYAALAVRELAPLVTADRRLVRKLTGVPGLQLVELSTVTP